MCERFVPMYVSVPCVCLEHAGAEEGITAPGTGVTERDNWRTGAENRAWVFWRATRALNHRGNFLAPERFFFFFFKVVCSRFLSIIDWNQIRNLKAGLVPPPLQPTRSPCIRTHGGNCLQAGSSSASTQSIFRSICPGMASPTELGHLTSVNYPGSSSQANLV